MQKCHVFIVEHEPCHPLFPPTKSEEEKRARERERGKGQTDLVRQNFEPVIKCMRRRWIRLSTLGHRSCFRIFTHPLSDSSSGCFVAKRTSVLPLYTSSVSLAPLHPFRVTRRFPYPGYVWNRVDRGNSLAWKFPRATSCCRSNAGMLTRQSQPSISSKLRLSISLSHRFIENHFEHPSWEQGRLSSLCKKGRKKESGENKKRKSALSLFVEYRRDSLQGWYIFLEERILY